MIWTQKIALSSCLCLTILTIICTITRISGIHTGRTVPSIDSVWGTYWQYVAANVALTMTAATAFRTFFVVRKDGVQNLPAYRNSWYTRGKLLLQSASRFLSILSRPRSSRSKSKTNSAEADENANDFLELRHEIPRGTMTGVRTFISGQGKTTAGHSRIMETMAEGEFEDTWPLSYSREAGGIKIQQHVISSVDYAC